jgi:hypothetical protein
METRISRLRCVAGSLAALALLTVGSSPAFAKSVKGSGHNTSVTTNFSYDGIAPALLFTGSGNDNIGGSYDLQGVNEFSATATPCTTSDGNPGLTFNLVESDGAGTYNGGQLYFTAVGATAGSYCLTATGEFTGSVTYDVSGGSGKFAHASGSVTITFKGQTLAAPGSPPGSRGVFGAAKFTESGSVKK